MHFAKLHGLGNSYVYIDLVNQASSLDWPTLARRVSDPAFGVGADGLILLLPSSRADFRMRIFNADGSEGEMCGNGIRCLARFADDVGLVSKNHLKVETLAGVLELELFRTGGVITSVRVDMGQPRLQRSEIPMGGGTGNAPVIDEDIVVGGTSYRVTALSMGNPHCVLFVDDVATAPVRTLGPLIETHPLFPNRTNVEFIQVIDRGNLHMRVWERGSGETQACGTGACAAVVAAALANRTERHVTVHLLGGQLEIEWAGNNHIYMSGPCEPICSGTLSNAWLAASERGSA